MTKMPKFSSILNRRSPAVGRLLRDRRGATAILLALALSAIVGFAGLGSEVASWYYTERSMQSAADSAASSVAAELASATLQGSTVSNTELTNTGRSVAATFNFVNGTGSTTVTINNPPSSTANLGACPSAFTGFNCYIEVLISQPQTPLLSAVFMSSGPTIATRAVALANTNVTPDGCIVALDSHSGDTGITLSGTPALTLTGCSLIDNSALSNGGTITAQAAYVVGSCSGCTSPSLVTTQHPSGSEAYTGVNPYPDPYLSLSVPSYTHGHCDQGNSNNGDKLTGQGAHAQEIDIPSGSTPFVFCNGVDVQGGATLVLCPGNYIIDRGQLQLEGGGKLLAPPTATSTPSISSACPGDTTGGVSIFLTNSTSTSGPPANINIGANSTSSFTAPSSGTYSGIAIMQDRMTCTNHNCGDSMQGGASQNLTGVMYFPDNIVTYNGGSSTGGSVCSKLIAYQITFSGNPNFQSSCSSAGTKLLSYTNGQIVM